MASSFCSDDERSGGGSGSFVRVHPVDEKEEESMALVVSTVSVGSYFGSFVHRAATRAGHRSITGLTSSPPPSVLIFVAYRNAECVRLDNYR